MNKQLKEFMNFVRAHGVVGLAVGLAIGAQVGKTVEALVEGIVTPLVKFIVGGSADSLETMKWTVVKNVAGGRSLTLGWGMVLSSLITLLAVSAVIYYIITGLKLDKIDKKD